MRKQVSAKFNELAVTRVEYTPQQNPMDIAADDAPLRVKIFLGNF